MKLSGFTLFKVPKGWQLSTREHGELGWSVRIVSEEVAEKILSSLGDATPPAVKPAPPKGFLDFRRETTAQKQNPPRVGRVRL